MHFSKISFFPDTIITNFPSIATFGPPITGISKNSTSDDSNFCEISFAEFGFIVLISATTISSCFPEIIPFSPKATSDTASASLTTVITRSEFSATSFGDSARVAPASTSFSVLSFVLLKTVTV